MSLLFPESPNESEVMRSAQSECHVILQPRRHVTHPGLRSHDLISLEVTWHTLEDHMAGGLPGGHMTRLSCRSHDLVRLEVTWPT
jgi:hypothetical protein